MSAPIAGTPSWRWTALTAFSNTIVNQIAVCSTGTYADNLVLVATNNSLYVMNGTGTILNNTGIANMNGVAMSTDASKMYACSNGSVYYSTDYGVTWTQPRQPVDTKFSAICCASDGTKVAVVSNAANGGGGYIWYNADPTVGSNAWIASNSGGLNNGVFTAVACIANGSKFVAVASNNGGLGSYTPNVYTSTDGQTWNTSVTIDNQAQTWTSAMNLSGLFFITSSSSGRVYTWDGSAGSWTRTGIYSEPFLYFNGNIATGNTFFCAGANSGGPSLIYSLNNDTLSYDPNAPFNNSGAPYFATSVIALHQAGTRVGLPLYVGSKDGNVSYGLYLATYTSPVICFKEGSKILCNVDGKEEYLPVETMRPGTLVKTVRSGYKKVEHIGHSKVYNPAHTLRGKNRLYVCTKANYPEITEDLVITGCHSILVGSLSTKERADVIDITGDTYVTDGHYRLVACADERALPYTMEGVHTIWHFALEHDDYYMNYGVYANGLLVETTSKRMMKELSGMELV